MNFHKETIPEIIAELAQAQALERNQILEYRKRISEAWRREKVRVNVQTFRAKKRSSVITDVITPMITSVITSDKEERTEKENLPPTPPIREKGKKEEMPPAAATRASRVREDRPSWEQVKERAEVSLKCRDFDRLPPIIEQIVKKRPHSNLFCITPIKKSRPSLCVECPERQNAPRHRDITTGIL
jgi:hypothetical protein